MIKKTAIWVLFAALSITGCKMMEPFIAKPTVTFEKMHLQEMSLFDATFLFTFAVHNPNPMGITIQRGDYKFLLEDAVMASGTVDRQLSVKARGSGLIDLPVHINFMDFFQSVNALALRDEMAYDLSGSFDVMGFTIPYKTGGKMTLPNFPEISVKNLMISELSLSGAKMNLILSVANPNAFAIGMDGLKYTLETGGITLARGTAQNISEIGKNERQDISIPVEVDFIAMGRQAMRLLDGNTAPYALSGDMHFTVPGGGKKTLPFSRTGEMSLSR